jgi:hypothetical protein
MVVPKSCVVDEVTVGYFGFALSINILPSYMLICHQAQVKYDGALPKFQFSSVS